MTYSSLLLAVLLLVMETRQRPLQAQQAPTETGLAPITLSSSYQYEAVAVTPKALPSALPLNWSAVSNAALVTTALAVGQSAQQAIQSNGFVVVGDGQEMDVVHAYSHLA